MPVRWSALVLVAVTACKPPPPAPEGLDASTAYMMQHFYDDDAMFQAGVQGFVAWYDGEGADLLGEDVTLENVDAYTVGELDAEVIAGLPVDPDIVVDPDTGETEPRDISRAKGVVSLAEMDCSWDTAEALLVRSDQDVVFSKDWEGYKRTYQSSRTAFEGARDTLEFAAVDAPLAPFDAAFDPTATETTLLLTHNVVDPTPVLTVNMGEYPFELHLRHGVYEIDGEDTPALAILTFMPAATWTDGGGSALLQSYSIELNVPRPGNKTLRMLAVWSEPKGGGLDPDDAIVLNFAVNKSLASSDQMSEICAGELEIPKE